MARKADILVVGGGGRIGAAVADRLAERARPVVRRSTGRRGEIVTADYATLPASAFDGVDRVVNCVGVSSGSRELLNRVNVVLPTRLAEAAREVGVRHMIHVSSFSIYGGAEHIGRGTPVAPVSDYGRSKAAADAALAALARGGFDVTLLRLPLVYAPDALGKLGRLLAAWRHIRVLPIPRTDVRRAMIGVDLVADTVARLCAEPPASGIVFAADPAPFTYRNAARANAEGLRCMALPPAVTRVARTIVPALADRLFADSRLDETDNLAIRYGLASRLYHDIAQAAVRG